MKRTLLVIAISTVLAACSSGGSDSSSNTTPKPTTPSVKPADKNLVLNNVSKNNLNKFVLNGKTIDLVPNGISSGGFFINNGGNFAGDTLTKAISGKNYTETRFGILVPKNAEVVAFSQGSVTPLKDIPTAKANVQYLGDSVTYNIEKKDFESGKVKVDVNFGLKEIKVTKKGTKYNATMAGTIKGNQFVLDGGNGKGQFYGQKAAELSGVHKNKNLVTAFGAKK